MKNLKNHEKVIQKRSFKRNIKCKERHLMVTDKHRKDFFIIKLEALASTRVKQELKNNT